MSVMATGQPWVESRCARARPMPDAAPEMTTVRPLIVLRLDSLCLSLKLSRVTPTPVRSR